jgi:hypothetical protein
MKRLSIVLGFFMVVSSGYLAASHFSGGAFPAFGLPVGGDLGKCRRMALSFLEDIQFKDFKSAAQYHSPGDQDSVDIPFLIWRLFGVKPEGIDFMEYEVIFAKIDSSGNRIRLKVRMKAKIVVRNEAKDQQMMLYFFRENKQAPWYMKFEDSLRQTEKDPNKKG